MKCQCSLTNNAPYFTRTITFIDSQSVSKMDSSFGQFDDSWLPIGVVQFFTTTFARSSPLLSSNCTFCNFSLLLGNHCRCLTVGRIGLFVSLLSSRLRVWLILQVRMYSQEHNVESCEERADHYMNFVAGHVNRRSNHCMSCSFDCALKGKKMVY